MTELTATQIIACIAYSNDVEPELIRRQIEESLQKIWQDKSHPHSVMLANLFPKGRPTTDEFIAAFQQELYDAMMPRFPDWEWDGAGYRNIRLLGKKRKDV